MTNTFITQSDVKIVNLTPHTVTFWNGERPILDIAPCENPPRCDVKRVTVGTISLAHPCQICQGCPGTDGFCDDPETSIRLTKTEFGDVQNLPDPESGTIFIVSRAVAEACPDRKDLFFPDDTVRDEQGRIVGCKALASVAKATERREQL